MKKLLTTLVLGLATAAGVEAQTWPDKPVTLLVPFPPGGSTDLIARVIAPKLQEKFGGTFLVENKPSGRHPTATRSSCRHWDRSSSART
jgi:tripartite-type tricarboxylate transporter receptor subunit TctC